MTYAFVECEMCIRQFPMDTAAGTRPEGHPALTEPPATVPYLCVTMFSALCFHTLVIDF